jgi:hypothetical protein
MYIAKVLSVATALLASALGITALTPPPDEIQYVGLGNKCGMTVKVDYRCLPGLTCTTMPGATTKTCVYISQTGGFCNRDHYKCAEGLTCVIAPGHWSGVCQTTCPGCTKQSVNVGLGDKCGLINGINYQCWPGLTCDTMPGAATKTCIYISQAGGICNRDHYKCAAGLTCDYATGQWNGVCRIGGTGSTTPSVNVGLGDKCGLINGVDRRCWSGMTCTTMPGATTKTCVYVSQVGGTCNRDHTRCAAGLRCVYPYDGAWHGVCKA